MKVIDIPKARERSIFWPLAVSSAVVVLRAVLAIRFVSAGDVSSLAFAVAEYSALSFTVLGLVYGRVDSSAGGLLVPFGYLVPLLFSTSPECRSLSVAVAMLACVFAQWVVLGWLGRCCSVGVPVFRAVVSSGPYACIRHPLSGLQCLAGVLFVVGHFSGYNLVILVLKLAAAVYCVVREENLLNNVPEYARYAQRVRSRWLPGVW